MNGDEILIPLVLFISAGAVAITHITARHRERMSVIARGLSTDEIKALYIRDIRPASPMASLKWGIVFIFAGLAVLLGNYLHDQYRVDDSVILGMICVFAGVALLLFYGIAAKKADANPWVEEKKG